MRIVPQPDDLCHFLVLYPVRQNAAQFLAEVPAGMKHAGFHGIDRAFEDYRNVSVSKLMKVSEVDDRAVGWRKLRNGLR